MNRFRLKDMENLHHYLDLLLRASHVLQANITVLDTLGDQAEQMRTIDIDGAEMGYDTFIKLTNTKIKELQLFKPQCNLIHDLGEYLALLVR